MIDRILNVCGLVAALAMTVVAVTAAYVIVRFVLCNPVCAS